MKEFEARHYDDKQLVLTSASKLHELYEALSSDEAVLLKWKDGGASKSKVLICSSIAGKVKTGDYELKSEESA